MPTLTLTHGRRFGRKADLPDGRDFLFKAPAAVVLPATTNNRVFCGPGLDQGQEGSCTAFAWLSNMEIEYRKFPKQTPVFSRRFMYYMERFVEGSLPDDSGAYSRTGAQVITKYGLCEDSLAPYDPSKMNTPPTQAMYENALTWRTGGYHRLTTLNDIKTCLADLGPTLPGHPFTIGFPVYDSFMGSQMENTGLMPIPASNEWIDGGHEVCVVDYDDSVVCPGASAGACLCQNSWGNNWGCDRGDGGRRGFFWMPYEFMVDALYSNDLWLCHHGGPWV